MINAAVIGCGYWGTNVLRNFASNRKIAEIWVADRDPKQLEKVSSQQKGVNTATVEEILASSKIDLVAIVTPVSSHFALAQAVLKSGKHVMVEKPMAASSEEAAILVALARDKRRVLAVDHTFLYTPAVTKIREILSSNALGKIWYFDSVRINLGLFQHDVNVIWDLAVHDISILMYTTTLRPVSVVANGIAHTPNGLEDIAYITMFFADDFLAHLHLNWLAPTKIRQIIIGGSEKMLIWDDLNQSEKLKIYDSGISLHSNRNDNTSLAKELVKYRIGDIWSPALEQTEALTTFTDELLDAIEKNGALRSSGELGLDVVSVLEACQESLSSNGKRVKVRYTESGERAEWAGRMVKVTRSNSVTLPV